MVWFRHSHWFGVHLFPVPLWKLTVLPPHNLPELEALSHKYLASSFSTQCPIELMVLLLILVSGGDVEFLITDWCELISCTCVACVAYYYTSRPCRTLFGSCPPPALGSRKADMKTLSFFFATSYPCHVRAQAAMKPRHHAWSAELPVSVPCTHFFYALSMITAGYVGVPCSYQQTLPNKGDHQQLQQLAHNNKTFEVRERSRFQSPESGPKHEAGRLARIILLCDMEASCTEYNA